MRSHTFPRHYLPPPFTSCLCLVFLISFILLLAGQHSMPFPSLVVRWMLHCSWTSISSVPMTPCVYWAISESNFQIFERIQQVQVGSGIYSTLAEKVVSCNNTIAAKIYWVLTILYKYYLYRAFGAPPLSRLWNSVQRKRMVVSCSDVLKTSMTQIFPSEHEKIICREISTHIKS